MYGSDRLNNHNILRYGLTIDFCQNFRSLKYLGIELPYVLIRHFHSFIKPFVDKNLNNRPFIKKLRMKHKIYKIKSVQQKLNFAPKMKRDLSTYTHRNTILMAGVFAPFALDQFPHSNVILINANHYDKSAIDKAFEARKLPGNISIFDFQKSYNRVVIPKTVRGRYIRQLQKLLVANRNHEIFGTIQFQRWMKKNLLRSLKWIHSLESLIRKQPVGLILDHFEITYPGNILGLIAKKYNLPFLLAPQVLITDRSLIPTRASRYLVWGKNYRRWLYKRGIPITKISITGNLKFEYEQKARSMPKSEFIQRLNIPKDHLIISFTSQTFSEQVNKKIMKWIRKSVGSQPITVVIRPHPYDSMNYKPYVKSAKIVLSPKEMHLYNIIENSDFIMTISSNTAIEAANLKKGIIILQPQLPYHFENNGNDFNSFLVRSRAGLTAYNVSDLRKYFRRLANDDELKNSVIQMGQKFLAETVRVNASAAVLTRRIIHNILKN